MSNPSNIYKIIFITACIFLVVEAVFSTLDEMKKPKSTTLAQATSWIRSIFMIVLAVVMFMLLQSTQTTSVNASSGY